MPLFMRTEKDPDGTQVLVERAFVTTDGRAFMLLRRLPPHYAKPPTFVAEITSETVERRGQGEREECFRALAYQSFTHKEIEFLKACKEGQDHLPFFNFSYPNIIKKIGKQFRCLSNDETKPMLTKCYKLVGGDR